ncbi:MAG: amino acid aminotransferase [Pseudopedobacter saltans]|uniref:branched-chain-amino-acid transaminase n=1 Tax=Pseudopedobacter saltans TaxID=151895 RepID=A0A2W5F816_9SPHI|nr:MAG: amino acid aminotransferase [Pseudopedobacter saltans]
MPITKAIVNGKIIAEEDASLGINDLSITRGYGIFDFFKTLQNTPIFWEDNLDRFFRSAKLMDLPVEYSKDELKVLIVKLMSENKIPDSGIKLLLTGGYSTDDYSISKPNLIITQRPLKRDLSAERRGIKLITYDFHRALATAKTTDYIMGIRALQKAKEANAQDVVYTSNGLVSECPRSNIFFVTKEGKIITPSNDVLLGITKMHVIELAKSRFEAEERDVTVEELNNAAEAFITSTTKNITPVLSINETVYGKTPGPITKKLQTQYERLIYG